MPTRKRINLGGPRNKGKKRGQKNKDTVVASADNIDLNVEDVSSATARAAPSDENTNTPRTSSKDLNPSTLTPSCPSFPSLSLSHTGSAVSFYMFTGDLDNSEPLCCLVDRPCWYCTN